MYRQDDVFLEVGYVLEASPYSPEVVLGLGSGRYAGGRISAVPLWHVVPTRMPEQQYGLWTFKTESELEAVLNRIKKDVLQPYARPLWQNPVLLAKSIGEFRKSAQDAKWRAGGRTRR